MSWIGSVLGWACVAAGVLTPVYCLIRDIREDRRAEADWGRFVDQFVSECEAIGREKDERERERELS